MSAVSVGHPEVDRLLVALRSGIQAVLGRDMVGLYLFGSLATGDFDPERSDVDFLVATERPPSQSRLTELAAVHARIEAEHPAWATPNRIEGSYIPRSALRRHDPADRWHPRYEAGSGLRIEPHDRDWVIQRHVLRQHGVVLAGPPPRTLIDPVAADDLRLAVREILRDWWRPMQDDPAPLLRPGYQVYTTLTLCRMLYTLETGAVTTKPGAARWALERVDPGLARLIEAALASRRGERFDRLAEVQRFIGLVDARARTLAPKQDDPGRPVAQPP